LVKDIFTVAHPTISRRGQAVLGIDAIFHNKYRKYRLH
jgi:hypothetical protein